MDLDGLYSNLAIFLIKIFENFAALITIVMRQMDIKSITQRDHCLVSSQHHVMAAYVMSYTKYALYYYNI